MADLNVNLSVAGGTYDATGITEDNGSSLVKNAGFENAPAFTAATTAGNVWIDGSAAGSSSNDTYSWGTKGTLTGSCSTRFDTSNFNSGVSSLKISTLATGSQIGVNPFKGNISVIFMRQYCVPVLASTAYSCSVWIKTTANSGSATTGARANFQEMNSSAALVSNHNTTAITTTTGWTKYTQSFTTGSTTVFIFTQLLVTGNDGTGTLIMDAWFDDVYIQKTTVPNNVMADMNPVVTNPIQVISGPKIWS